MSHHQILINGVRLDPRKAAEMALPLDTALACPKCGSQQVAAKEAKTVERFAGDERARVTTLEFQHIVPRLQDRHCLHCSHRWETVLPPTGYTDGKIIIAR